MHVQKALGPNASNRYPENTTDLGDAQADLSAVQRFWEATLALRTLLHTDRSPSLGYMTAHDGTTLHEAGHLLVSFGFGLSLRSDRTVLMENAILITVRTGVPYTSEVEHRGTRPL